MRGLIQENYWLLVILAMAALLFYKRYGLYLKGIKPVGSKAAGRLIDEKDALVLDVREADEYASGRIPGARHMPLRNIGGNLEVIHEYRNHPVLVSCRSGSLSAHACTVLKKNGFGEVYNLRGGVSAWARANHSLER